MQYQFDEMIEKAIEKSVKSTQRFYNELRKGSLEKGTQQDPPTLEVFTSMAKGLMEATKQAQVDKLRTPSLRDLLDRAWNQKLLNYSTQKLLKDSYEALAKKF